MKKEAIDWLLGGPAWLKYTVECQLLNLKPYVKPVLQDDLIVKIMKRLKDKKVGIPALKSGTLSYKSSSPQGNVYWDLLFLADIGLTAEDLNLCEDMEDILKLQSADGTFVTMKDMKPGYLCISLILLTSIAKMHDKRDIRSKIYLGVVLDSRRLDGGWHCAQSRAKGRSFRTRDRVPWISL